MTLEDRENIAQRLLASGAHLVLAGHVHRHYFHEMDGTRPPHIMAGTAMQQCAEHDFWQIDIYERSIQLMPFVRTKNAAAFIEDRNKERKIDIPLPASPAPLERIKVENNKIWLGNSWVPLEKY